MEKTLKIDIDQHGDYCSFLCTSESSHIILDKIWVTPADSEYDWKMVLDHLRIMITLKNVKSEQKVQTHSFPIDIEVDPNLKTPEIILNRRITTTSFVKVLNSNMDFDTIVVSFVGQRGLAPFQVFLQMSYDEDNTRIDQGLEVMRQQAELSKSRLHRPEVILELKAKAQQLTVPIDYHDVAWACKAILRKQLDENDFNEDVMDEIRSWDYYKRVVLGF